MAHPEAHLISAILRTGDYASAIHGGISKNVIHVHTDEWNWIERFVTRYRKTPSKATFRTKFPDFRLKAVDDVTHCVDEVKGEHARYQLSVAIDKALLLAEKDDMDKAVDGLHSDIVAIQSTMGGESSDFDLVRDYTEVYDDVSARVKKVITSGQAGLPTGFPTLDMLTGGPQPGDFFVIAARLGVGKALVNGTGVMTPKGYLPIEELVIGDKVMGSSGKTTRVIGTYPQGEREILDVTFSDGSVIQCCEDHLWNVRIGSKPYRVQTTGQIAKWIESGNQRPTVPTLSSPAQFNEYRVTFDPYKMGLLLGDGCFRAKDIRFSTVDPELVDVWNNPHQSTSRSCDYSIPRLVPVIKRFGLFGLKSVDKFIPEEFLWSGVDNRLAVLQGLMDTDGGIEQGQPVFGSRSPHLIAGVKHLVESLGGTTHTRTKTVLDRPFYIMSLSMPMCPFRLRRKAEAWRTRSKYHPARQIVSAVRTGAYAPMTCIAVDAPDSLFVTEHFIVTHNTWTMVRMACAAVFGGASIQYDALEQSRKQVAFRCHSFMSSKYGEEVFRSLDLHKGKGFDLRAYRAFLKDLKNHVRGRMFISDTSRGRVSPITIAAQIERNKVDCVFIDYLTLMEGKGEDWRATAKLSAEIKQLAQRYEIPIIAAAQINRMGSGKEPPKAEHIGQSDAIGQDADAIITMSQYSTHVLKMKLAKYRHGQDGETWYTEFAPNVGKFDEVSGDRAEEIIEDDANADDE